MFSSPRSFSSNIEFLPEPAVKTRRKISEFPPKVPFPWRNLKKYSEFPQKCPFGWKLCLRLPISLPSTLSLSHRFGQEEFQFVDVLDGGYLAGFDE